MDWKKYLVRFLKEQQLVNEEYTGRLVINLNQGSITDAHKVTTSYEGDCKIERTERIK